MLFRLRTPPLCHLNNQSKKKSKSELDKYEEYVTLYCLCSFISDTRSKVSLKLPISGFKLTSISIYVEVADQLNSGIDPSVINVS